ncbi:MAG TPA: indolepyruvate ferredoxin oxidoreductase subunit alpha [Methanotrichaceae archaeon]|nr:indolepyruvate ferredoxin oxidoreductase subunit alpha [Methanotrichaceae archaeon]
MTKINGSGKDADSGGDLKSGPTGVDVLRMALSDLEVEVRVYVPGYPATDAIPALGDKAQMDVNEKVAMEVALGASATGKRSLVLVKHLGVNVLSDPLSIAPTHTIGAGLVVLASEDVGPRGSQAEMDVRNYGPLCEVPVLDPSGPERLRPALLEAFALSEKVRAPVMVRTTFEFKDLARKSSSSPVHRPERVEEKGRFGTFDRSIWDLTSKGRHQRYRTDVLPQMRLASSTSSLNFLRDADEDLGIIASGRPASLVLNLKKKFPLLVAGFSHPLPWDMIRDFVEKRDRVLVAEEPTPFIESRLQICNKIFGKTTGHLPWGRMESQDLERALELIATGTQPGPGFSPQRFEDRPGSKNVCDDCPYWPVYEAVRNLGVSVAGDAGCSIRAVRPPLDAVDVVYGLGSSVGVASGFGEKGVALVGDYALAHSGLQGLIDSVNNKREVLVVLLQNGVAAMTGGQPVPDITPILDRIVQEFRTIELPANRDSIGEVLKEELAKPGVSLVVVRGICPRRDSAT